MSKYYFYTDPNTIPQQIPGQEFGPFQVGNPTSSGEAKKDKYQITNLHTGSNSPAIAICDGIICVQPDDQGTFSIILKPNYQPDFNTPFIKYFIYKGVKKSSLVTTDALVDDSLIPFTQRVKNAWEDPIGDPSVSNPINKSAKVLGLQFDSAFSFNLNGTPTNIFEDEDSLDNLFYYPNDDFQFPIVNAGEKIANFDTNFGFEIVFERLGFEPKIKLSRKKENKISVDAIVDPLNSSSSWAIDDEAYFMHWNEKESCLNYLDPCAFYGCFSESYISVKNGASETKYKTADDIYANIVSKFTNKHKVYLDFRNGHAYSLNYFKNYGYEVSFSNNASTSQIDINQNRNNWPLLIIEKSELVSVGNVISNKISTNLSLSLGDCKDPFVFLSKSNSAKKKSTKENEMIFFPKKISSVNKLESFPFSFILKSDSSNFISNYYKINLYDLNKVNSTNLKPDFNYYLDSLFRPIQMNLNNNLKFGQGFVNIWHDELIVHKKNGNPFIGNIGVSEDNEQNNLFSIPHFYIFKKNKPLLSWTSKILPTDVLGIEELIKSLKSRILEKITLNIIESSSTKIVDTVTFEKDYEKSSYENIDNRTVDDIEVLMFDKLKYKALIASIKASSLIESLPIFLNTKTSINKFDSNGILYTELELEIQGYEFISSKIIKKILNINLITYNNAI